MTTNGSATPHAAWWWGTVAAIGAGFLLYSQTLAFCWDEGFHLLAAWLLSIGRQPYIDFFHAQPPWNTCWNALVMRAFGPGWHMPHLAAALFSTAALLLATEYVWRRFPVAEWRLAATLTTAVTFGLNAAVLEFGTVGQAYGLCLLLLMVAFRATVATAGRRTVATAFAAGLASCAAASSSLLTLAAAPVYLFWMLRFHRQGSRSAKAAAFLAGGLVASAPLLWFLVKAPRNVLFEVVGYHALYRRIAYEDYLAHDLLTLTVWLESAQALSLVALAAAALLYLRRACPWPAAYRAEQYLCAWLAIGMSLFLACARPTFSWYFLLVVPFLAILAATGMFSLGVRLLGSSRPLLPVLAYTALLAFSLARGLYAGRDDFRWSDIEPVAKRVNEVVPLPAPLFADEHVYLLAGRVPPSGMEYNDSHKLNLPPERAAALHVESQATVKSWLKDRRFAAAESCDGDRVVEELGLPHSYRRHEIAGTCRLFWEGADR